jgi:hypothetical protein
MRFILGMVFLLVAGLVPANNAYGQVMGMTQVTIGAATITAPPANIVTVPFTLELDSTTKGYAGIQVVCKETGFFGGVINPFVSNPVPAAGAGPVNGAVTYQGVKGQEYKITITMQFMNAMGMLATTTATKTFTP